MSWTCPKGDVGKLAFEELLEQFEQVVDIIGYNQGEDSREKYRRKKELKKELLTRAQPGTLK